MVFFFKSNGVEFFQRMRKIRFSEQRVVDQREWIFTEEVVLQNRRSNFDKKSFKKGERGVHKKWEACFQKNKAEGERREERGGEKKNREVELSKEKGGWFSNEKGGGRRKSTHPSHHPCFHTTLPSHRSPPLSLPHTQLTLPSTTFVSEKCLRKLHL